MDKRRFRWAKQDRITIEWPGTKSADRESDRVIPPATSQSTEGEAKGEENEDPRDGT